MKKLIIRSALVCACVLFAAVVVGAQSKANDRKPATPSGSSSIGATAAKVPVVIVGSAAKVTWAATKFTAKHVAKPVAKTLFLKATPAITKFALKNTAKHLLPYAVKLSVL